jgi:DNA polymerase-3 subunit gamma/tau
MLAFTGDAGSPAAAPDPTLARGSGAPARAGGAGGATGSSALAADNGAAVPAAGGKWEQMLASLGISGIARELARHCELVKIDGGAVTLRLAELHQHLASKLAQEKIQAALSEYLQQAVRLSIEIGKPSSVTPAARDRSESDARQARAVASIEQDSFVREMVETFDARINDASIKPV